MKKFFLSFPLVGALALTIVLGAAAAVGYTLFGDALIVSPANASAHAAAATTTGPNAFGGVDFAVPAGLTVSQVQNLSTDYRFTLGTCGLGSPRFVVRATNGTSTGNINFYLGPPPNYTACPPTVWTNTGNLASPANLVDSSQLPGGTFYDPYAAVLVKYGSYTVTDIFLVADGPSQTVQFDRTQVNDTTYGYEPPPTKDDCKNGGYADFDGSNGSPGPFKNQGDCVSYFSGGH